MRIENMKIVFNFFLLFCITIAFAQEKNTEVVYKFILVKDSIDNSKMADFIKKDEYAISKIAYKIKPKLVFNDSVAVFYSDELLDEDNSHLNQLARVFCYCEKPVFYSKKDDKIYYNFPEGLPNIEEDYTIYDNLTKNWTLTNETKQIDHYTCYKATTKFESPTSSTKTITKNTVAWYCPELPFSYGPNGYGGLPGLIVELQENNVFYGMESIKIKSSTTKVKPIKMHKLKTLFEFYVAIEEGMARYRKNK